MVEPIAGYSGMATVIIAASLWHPLRDGLVKGTDEGFISLCQLAKKKIISRLIKIIYPRSTWLSPKWWYRAFAALSLSQTSSPSSPLLRPRAFGLLLCVKYHVVAV